LYVGSMFCRIFICFVFLVIPGTTNSQKHEFISI
jgi:hypothetical protein